MKSENMNNSVDNGVQDQASSSGKLVTERQSIRSQTVDIVCAAIAARLVDGTDELVDAINRIGKAVACAGNHEAMDEKKAVNKEPAVSPKKSVFPDYIICLEDGKKMKLLRRHLKTAYGMTPDQYRKKWGLPASYPMVAPNYASRRSELARVIGLGRKPGETNLARKARISNASNVQPSA